MGRRRKKHEEHANHEAWAIPYGDLITLLLAFFVVMYAISTVNEGKYRVLSDALFAAFRGSPRTVEPIQVGEKQVGSGSDVKTNLTQEMLQGQPRSLLSPVPIKTGLPQAASAGDAHDAARAAAAAKALERVADEVVRAMDDLVRANVVFVRRKSNMIEVEIRTDILFPSGRATLSPSAVHVIERLADALKPFPNPVRVEGYTDSRPIRTVEFPSNWELSAGRAASVVHLLASDGIEPERLSVIGHGEFSPAQSNDTVEGRNANRRVVIVILSSDGATPGAATEQPAEPNAAPPLPSAVSVAPSPAIPSGSGISPGATSLAPSAPASAPSTTSNAPNAAPAPPGITALGASTAGTLSAP